MLANVDTRLYKIFMDTQFPVTFTRWSGEAIAMDVSFSYDELMAFKQFCDLADRLMNSKFMHASVKLSIDSEARVVNLPEYEDMAAFLHMIRPYILQNEAANFVRICGILGKELNHVDLRKYIGQGRDIYEGKPISSKITYARHGTTINSNAVLMKWLNAYEYHNDVDKRREIDELFTCHDTSVFFFVLMLQGKVHAIEHIRRMILHVLAQVPKGYLPS